MEQARHVKLDGYGEDAGEALDQINSANEALNDARSAALQYMRQNNVTTYVAAGVRFSYTHGVEKVSVKRVKEKGQNKADAADVEDLEGSGEGSDIGGSDAGEGAEA